MRSLKSGLFAIAFAGLFGTAAVVGCSADGAGSGIDTESDPTLPDPNGSSGSVVPERGPDPTPPADGGKDSGKKDAGPKPEAGVDAGPPPPVEGTACTTLNEIKQKSCGACGKSETVCLADGTTGKGKWSPYGVCGNELSGGCVPGTTVNEACGNCGTVTKTCTQYCAYSAGACTGQPANSCVPGTVDYTTAGCGVSTYRNRSCGATCTYGSYSATCEEPINANKMTISGAVNGVVTAQWTLAATQVGKKVSGTCGVGSVSSTATYPWVAVEVKNPTAQTATIQVYHSGTGNPLDTLIWIYKKTLPPNDTTLGMCDFGAADSCITGDPCGNTAAGGSTLDWAGVDNVTIPPGGKILVYSAGYGSSEVGPFNLNLKTTKLQ
jgi:hypothetical protein